MYVSIIVPVYNKEKYLRKCLESIQTQSHTAFEVILVDDGSIDSSRKICEEYSAKDKRFKYLYQENGGQTSARRKGILNAIYKYVLFIDADDWIEENYLQIMLLSMENSKNYDLIASACPTGI